MLTPHVARLLPRVAMQLYHSSFAFSISWVWFLDLKPTNLTEGFHDFTQCPEEIHISLVMLDTCEECYN